MNSVGTYRTQGSPENLKIRVEICKASSARPFVVHTKRHDSVELQPLKEKQELTEKYTFTWQEKAFSKDEAEFYRQRYNCISYLHNKYHDVVADPKYEVEKKTRRLSTLVHTDIEDDTQEMEEKVTTAKNEVPNYLVENALRHRKNKSVKHHRQDVSDTGIVLSFSQSPDRISSDPSSRLMLIVADIQPDDELRSLPEDVTLCKLGLSAQGVLTACPDFNSWKNAYTLQNSKLDTFTYTISHSSHVATKDEVKREKALISSILNENKLALEKQVGHIFEMPPADLFKAYIFGEIVSAEGFGSNNLFISYSIQLPTGWLCEDTTWLSGVTQKCLPKTDGLEDSAYFSFPFDGAISFPCQKTLHGPDGLVVKWPLLFVEVWSCDFWKCLRSEGYGYVTLPSTSGHHNLVIQTWRPAALSVRSQLERFFFGQTADVDDLSLLAIPKIHKGQQLSKLGLRTESMGNVRVRLNVVHQAESFLHQISKKHTLLDKLELSAAENSVDAVLAAFNRARQRMLAARANLL